MRYEHPGPECPSCGLVMRVLYVPWPYTGEWMVYEHPKFCPACGARMNEGRYDSKEGAWPTSNCL